MDNMNMQLQATASAIKDGLASGPLMAAYLQGIQNGFALAKLEGDSHKEAN